MARPALPVHSTTGLRAIGFRRSGGPVWPIAGAEDPPAPPAPQPPAPPPPVPQPPGPAGGEEALRADLARERDRRQAAEAEVARLRAAQPPAPPAPPAPPVDWAQQLEAARLAGEQAAREQERHNLARVTAGLILTTAREHAQAIGVRPEPQVEAGKQDRVARFLSLVDLTNVQIRDDGTFDEDEVRKRIDETAAANPEFKTGTGRFSAAPGSGQGPQPTPPENLQPKVHAALAAMTRHTNLKTVDQLQT